MKIQITNLITDGKSEIFDFSELSLNDLRVIIDYCGEIKIEKK